MSGCVARIFAYGGYLKRCILAADHEGPHTSVFPTGTEYHW